ncbi:MAG: altronate dehydratase [Lentisphaeria bacterium]|nr:altronate dehydratase [Lentisphaeria bacterium]
MDKLLKIHPLDNVAVALAELSAGEEGALSNVPRGHKIALKNIARGENIIKYGMPIGHALEDIAAGSHVHTHNVKTNLSGQLEYQYTPDFTLQDIKCDRTFMGYRRADGQVGIRNDIWIVPTVGCVNGLVRNLAKETDSIPLCHPYGCSQMGDDHEMTADLLAALVHNPNAGGVLVVALGCENNTLESFKKRLGDYSKLNIRFMLAQEENDEFEKGLELIAELKADRVDERTEIPVSELKVGLKCGGSDGFSGLTANPLVGRFSDWITAQGGTSVLTEVPEMFGAETLLMNRCVNREVFDKCVSMVNDFKAYYENHNQVVYENPSPGNKAGGITTLEDKSLGCVQKGGISPVFDVLPYGERLKTHGLNLITGPGNDIVACTVLAAAGCHIILFTTGRGNPMGSVVPTVKLATNSDLAARKKNWIDYDAQANPETEKFVDYIINVANGAKTSGELRKDYEIAIFKDGVTL